MFVYGKFCNNQYSLTLISFNAKAELFYLKVRFIESIIFAIQIISLLKEPHSATQRKPDRFLFHSAITCLSRAVFMNHSTCIRLLSAIVASSFTVKGETVSEQLGIAFPSSTIQRDNVHICSNRHVTSNCHSSPVDPRTSQVRTTTTCTACSLYR